MSNLSEFIGPVIKSVQSGTTSTLASTNVTLTTAIDPAKSFIMINGTAFVGSTTVPPYGRATIIDSTTIQIQQTNTSTISRTITVYWTVVEYY